MEVIRITQKDDFSSNAGVQKVKDRITSKPGTSLHGSLPCTVWSTWQFMSIAKHGMAYNLKLEKRRAKSKKMLKAFIECAELALSLGGEVSFEWPRHCTGWLLEELIRFIHRNNLYAADVDGCACGMENADGEPLLKQWKFISSSPRVAASLATLRCSHPTGFKHGIIQGSTTKGTESYPLSLCRTLLSSYFGYHNFTPTMCGPCVTDPTTSHGIPSGIATHVAAGPCCTSAQCHREREVKMDDFQISSFCTSDLPPAVRVSAPPGPVPAAVHKLLDRAEIKNNPGAMEALEKEKQGLLSEQTWLEETVVDMDDLLADVHAKGLKIHLGELMPIASIKHWETPELRKYKGRIVFRGDNVKDQDGAMAVFQELSASPAAVHTLNSNIAYGLLAGNKTTAADALQAYLQADLHSKFPTWVRIPRELWPKEWHGRKDLKKPMCRLKKSLYGHPESGGHWEKHLTKALVAMGAETIKDHPSSFWFAEQRLFLSVYVDDLLLSGPEGAHEQFYTKLRNSIKVGDPEDLDRYLGRDHKYF